MTSKQLNIYSDMDTPHTACSEDPDPLRLFVNNVCATHSANSCLIEYEDFWLQYSPRNYILPDQGWKLHVSASILTALPIAKRILEILILHQTMFKIARSLLAVAALNEGEAGLSQMGKFVTVYPSTDMQAVELARLLDAATKGLAGPPVPSDRALSPGSALYYRYGAFRQRALQLPYGEIVDALVDPDGQLVPDRRNNFFTKPEWVTDPFVAAGFACSPPLQKLVHNRILSVSILSETPRGDVFLGIDLECYRRCIVKRGSHGMAVNRDGRDARDQIRSEYEILCRLKQHRWFPEVYELLENDNETLLIMEDIDGETLASLMMELRALGKRPTIRQICSWGKQIARALMVLHDRGMVYRDLKPSNIIVTSSGRLRIIDFELTWQMDSKLAPMGHGTRGYMSPQQMAAIIPAISDDVYSFGAVLYFLATGADPGQTPDADPMKERPLYLLKPAMTAGLEAVITRCLENDPAKRFKSMKDILDSLKAVEQEPTLSFSGELSAVRSDDTCKTWGKMARKLGQTLVHVSEKTNGGEGLTWQTNGNGGNRIVSRDINTGTAGIVLALAELVHATRSPELAKALKSACVWLKNEPAPEGDCVPGLYVGESGIAVALLRAAQVLEDASVMDEAVRRSVLVSKIPHRSPDLFNGSAGRLRMHLMMWDATHDDKQLQHAIQAGEFLLDTVKSVNGDGYCWEIPPGFDELSNKAFLGYAHGAAGIADSLIDLYESSNDERFMEAAKLAAIWLSGQVLPALSDGTGAEWPTVTDGIAIGPMWCHGATGIGQFFLHASQHMLVPDAFELAVRAAKSVDQGCALGPVQCHGLAGSIEYLLDLYQMTHEPSYLDKANRLGQILKGFSCTRDKQLLWASDLPTIFSPAYMTGYAGVAVCLLRLSDPVRRPRHLSRSLFRMC